MDELYKDIEHALARLAEELSARDKENLSVQVSEPDEIPPVAALARLINQYGAEVGSFLETEAQRQKRRSDELMQAYNALQAQTEEMNKELGMARRIQERLLPLEEELPDRPEISCAGYYQAMSNVGGDLYDIIRVGRNAYGILIADVSGHGIPAALITALVKISFRTKIHWGVSTDEVCRQVNAEIYPLLNDLDYFVTAFFCIMDLEKGSLQYTNCGHDPALIQRLSAEQPIQLDTRGRFLGAFDEGKYEAKSIELEPGDTVFVFTDGIIESRSLLDEEYTIERLLAFLADCEPLEPEQLVKAVERDMNDFCMGAPPRDDRTMFAVKFVSRTDVDHELAAGQSGGPGGDEDLPESLAPAPALPAAAPDGAPRAPAAANPAVMAILKREIPQAMARKEWHSAVAMIKTLDGLGGAEAGHRASLATIYYRAGRFKLAEEQAKAGLAQLDAAPAANGGDTPEKLRNHLLNLLQKIAERASS